LKEGKGGRTIPDKPAIVAKAGTLQLKKKKKKKKKGEAQKKEN